MESFWSLITIIGPVLLIAAIIYAYMRSRSTTRAEEIAGERGAKEVREDIREHNE